MKPFIALAAVVVLPACNRSDRIPARSDTPSKPVQSAVAAPSGPASLQSEVLVDFTKSNELPHQNVSPETMQAALAFAGIKSFYLSEDECKSDSIPAVVPGRGAAQYVLDTDSTRQKVVNVALRECETPLWNWFSVLVLFEDDKPIAYLQGQWDGVTKIVSNDGTSLDIIAEGSGSQQGEGGTFAQLIGYARGKLVIKKDFGFVRWSTCGVGRRDDDERASVISISNTGNYMIRNFRKSCRQNSPYKYFSDGPLTVP